MATRLEVNVASASIPKDRWSVRIALVEQHIRLGPLHRIVRPQMQQDDKCVELSGQPMTQPDAWRMIRKRAAAVGIFAPIGNHSFRATGITAYLANGGAMEHAQEMAAHESPRTTKLYDRTKERLSQDEVERIRL